jgi:hypothetical protein
MVFVSCKFESAEIPVVAALFLRQEVLRLICRMQTFSCAF